MGWGQMSENDKGSKPIKYCQAFGQLYSCRILIENTLDLQQKKKKKTRVRWFAGCQRYIIMITLNIFNMSLLDRI